MCANYMHMIFISAKFALELGILKRKPICIRARATCADIYSCVAFTLSDAATSRRER